MNLKPLQPSFSAGEITPLMLGRTDTEGYKSGLAVMAEMFPDSRGGAVGRQGSHFINKFAAGNDARVFNVNVNESNFYSVILVEQELFIGSVFGHNPSLTYTTNSNFNLGADSWSTDTDGNTSSYATFNYGNVEMSVAKQLNRFVEISQNFVVPAVGDYSILYSFYGVEEMTINVGTTEGASDVFSGTVPNGEFQIIFNATSTNLWITIRLDSDNIDILTSTVNYLGVSDENVVEVSFVTPYLTQDLEDLQFVESPSGGALYILHEFYPPYKLTYDPSSDIFTFTIVVFSSPPPQWATKNYPSTGTFLDGRLWLGGTINEPQTFWGSKSGLPEDFDFGTSLDDEAIEFTLAQFGRIEWIAGLKNLLIGTVNGEHIASSEGGTITPTDIQINQQSSYGSANIQPIQVGDQVFYVSADRRKLRAMQYEWQADNYLSKDLTFTSEHITKPGIKHIAWLQNPSNQFVCVLKDGTMAILTYERGNNIYGWNTVNLGDAVLDIASGSVYGTDYATFLTQRTEGEIYFEVQVFEDNINYMDSWVKRFPDPADPTLVTELDHLEGRTCQVMVDGGVSPDAVVTGGQITLQRPGSEVVVGLQYTPAMKTLPIDLGAPSGSGMSIRKHYNKIFVRILDSAKPLINGERPATRNPSTPMNTAEQPRTEDIKVVNLGNSRSAEIEIKQDLPLPLTVLAIYGDMSQSSLS